MQTKKKISSAHEALSISSKLPTEIRKWIHFIQNGLAHYSDISIVDFENVNTSWGWEASQVLYLDSQKNATLEVIITSVLTI